MKNTESIMMIEKNEIEIMKNWRYQEPPLLSVACIVYNHENYISEALDGILMQKTDFPFEIIVHDDCSTDSTVSILKKYKEKYPNIIKLILQKENQYSQGIKPDRPCIEYAVGKYFAMCEGDDYWIDPYKLQIQLNEMQKIENCQMSFHSAIDRWEDNSRKDSIRTKQAEGNTLFTVKEIISGGGGFCPTASLVFEKEAIMNLPEWFDRSPFGDYFLQIFGSLKGGALYIDRSMSVYRRNSLGSWSSTMLDIKKKEKELERTLTILEEMDNYFDQQYSSEIKEIISQFYLTQAYVYLYNKDFKKFNKSLLQSYNFSENKSKKLILSFYLKKFPSLLLLIGRLNMKYQRFITFKG